MESSPDNSELSEHVQFSCYNQFAYIFAFEELQLQFLQFYCTAAYDFHVNCVNLQQREFFTETLIEMLMYPHSAFRSVLLNVSTFQRDFPEPF